MSSAKRMVYTDREGLGERLQRDLLARIGNGVFVQEITKTREDALQARLGMVVPEVIEDPAKEEKLVSFLRHEDVARVRFEARDDKWWGEPIDREAFFEKVRRTRQDLVSRAEKALITATKHKIARVQPVGVGLNKVREILIQVNEEDTFHVTSKKHKRYVPILRGLKYVEAEGSVLHPGEELQKFEQEKGEILTSSEFYDSLLGEILERGYSELVENLRVRHVIPIVRLATAYYWSSAQYGEILEFSPADFRTAVKKLHPGYDIGITRVHNYLIEMDRADILQRSNGVYQGDDDVWDEYEDKAEQILGPKIPA